MSTTGTEAESVRDIAQQAARPEVVKPGDLIVVAAERGGVTVKDLEFYAEHPRRAKADRTVYDAGSFAAYLHRHEGAATEVYADVQAARVVAIIDSHEAIGEPEDFPGEPGWQEHRITLQLTKSPSWLAWEEHDGKFLPQSEFAEFAEMQAADVREPSPADLLELAQQMEITKGVAFEGGQRLFDGQTRLTYKETVEARAGQRGDLEIPSSLRLALKPYIGGPTYAVVARFRYRLRGQSLVLGYVLERPDVIQDLAFSDVVESLREGQPTKDGAPGFEAIEAPIFMGKP